MAGSLQGMFQQLNQAIGGNPLGGEVGGNLFTGMSENFGNVAGAAMGTDPMSFMSPAAKQQAGAKQIGNLDLGTAEGMEQAAQIYGQMGMQDKQVAMSNAAEQKRTQDMKLQQEQRLRETLVRKYQDRGMVDQAEAIASGAVELEEAARDLRDMEREDLLIGKSAQARKAVAKSYGIDEPTFNALGMGEMTDDQFKDTLNGVSAETKAYTDASGNATILRTNKAGLVEDPNNPGSWVSPSVLGLKPNINVQKVLNVDGVAKKELAVAGVENFATMYEKANNALAQIGNIDRSLENLEAMPTGIGAPIEMFVKRTADYLGMEQPDVANYEQFIAEAGKRVAEQIKAFGSGTGLSDADREYAKLIAAADPSMKAESLKNLLMIHRRSALETVDLFNSVKDQYKTELGDEGYLLNSFQLTPVPSTPTGDPQLSDSAKGYFE